MSIDIKVEVKRLPNNEWYREVVSLHRTPMNVCRIFVNAKIVHDDGTAGDDVSMKEVTVHVQKENCNRRQAPHDGQVEENRFAESFAVNKHFWIVDCRVSVGLDVVAVDGWNVKGIGEDYEVAVKKTHDHLR